MIIFKQLIQGNSGNIHPLDFVKSKPNYPSDKWLNNKHGNGWSIENPYKVYTNFTLELRK